MRTIGCLLLCFLFCSEIFGQSDSLTMREDQRFQYIIRKSLLSRYEKLLNFISDKSNFENEIPEIIKTHVKGSREQKLFSDERVIIENDLKPGGESDKLLRSDQEVTAYLNNFNTGYTKSEDKTVFLNYVGISPLKKTSYFYYNLTFECVYKSTNSAGQIFNPFTRVAEIKLVNDSGWHMYINGVRFIAGNENDTLNTFHDLIPSDTNLVNIYNAYDDEEQQKIREQKRLMQLLMDEGQDNYKIGNLNDAMKKFHEARMAFPDAREPKDWSLKVRNELERKRADAERKDFHDQRVTYLKKEALLQKSKLNFPLAKTLADSLIYEYGENESWVKQMSADLSIVNAAIEGINNTRLKGKTDDAIKLCQKKQVEITDSFYCAHFYYLEAELLSADPKPAVRHITEILNKAIDLSEKRHMGALKMRSYIRMEKQKNPAGAIEDATLLVNNDPRNPEGYDFRASIYERDHNIMAAIADYNNAIANKTRDPLIYLKKAQLEYAEKKFNEAIKSATDGMEFTGCNALLYFYRGLAEFYSLKIPQAGKDFRKATKECNLGDKEKEIIKSISDSCLNSGNSMMAKDQWMGAVLDLSKSIMVDSNDNALYQRAVCYIAMNMNDSAVNDLYMLSARNPVYRNVYALRGTAQSNLGRYDKANSDFAIAVRQFPDDTMAYYRKGKSEINQKNFKAAVNSLEQSAKLFQSDSVYYQLSVASYYDRNYDQAIKYSLKARSKRTNNFEIFYICGRAYYDLGDYKSALEQYALAKANISYDPQLWFSNANALEAMRSFSAASVEYDQLTSSPEFRDTSSYRAAVCKIKNGEVVSFPKAISQLNQYLRSATMNTDKSEPYSWKAYAYLMRDSVSQSADAITEAKKYNESNALLQLVLACRSTRAEDYENACIFLERALSSKEFKKEDIEQMTMLTPLKKKNKKYKMLMQVYFP